MKTNARNELVGKVTSIKKGDMMCQVKVEVPANVMTSVMTVDSMEAMDLREGDQVQVAVKAVSVVLIKP